jgi:hypothetical protein
LLGKHRRLLLRATAVGCMGVAYQAWFIYWMSLRNIVQFIYRNGSMDRAFIPGGGAWQPYALKGDLSLKSGLHPKPQLQHEHISHDPILFNGRRSNVTAILELGYFNPGEKNWVGHLRVEPASVISLTQ